MSFSPKDVNNDWKIVRLNMYFSNIAIPQHMIPLNHLPAVPSLSCCRLLRFFPDLSSVGHWIYASRLK
jgi:hypothetical protein